MSAIVRWGFGSRNATETRERQYFRYVVLVNGIVSPILVAVTLLTNICVCVVLVRPNMRSATNTLLVAMAVSDTLTGLCPLPAYFRFYSRGNSTLVHFIYFRFRWRFLLLPVPADSRSLFSVLIYFRFRPTSGFTRAATRRTANDCLDACSCNLLPVAALFSLLPARLSILSFRSVPIYFRF